MISFNRAPYTGKEIDYIKEAIASNKISGDGKYTKKCSEWLENNTNADRVLLTTSCSQALEMSALLCDIEAGDEVIMPSFTFVSTANAFVLRGAKIVFVDIRPDTQNINEELIEDAITAKTKVIVPVHYAGISCEMDKIMNIAKRHDIRVVEDAAQGVMASYKGKALGSIGDFGCFSFHETKNYSMGEGGAFLINNSEQIELAEIIREKGTNRSRFLRGQVDKYTWVEKGSSFLPSELNAAYLLPQLEIADEIRNDRLKSWNLYFEALKPFAERGLIELPSVPDGCFHNAHMFYIKVRDINQRTELIDFLKQNEIIAVFHYVPLHTAKAGKRYGRFHGEDIYTTKESERLIRLPMYYGLKQDDIEKTVSTIFNFFRR